MKLRVLVLSLLVAAVGLALVPVAAPQTKATTSTVTVTMKEFKFILSTKTVHHGSVTFKLVNKGHLGHDFSISGHKSKTIGAGKTGTFTVTLSAGHKPYKCTIDGHAAAGMKGVLTVT